MAQSLDELRDNAETTAILSKPVIDSLAFAITALGLGIGSFLFRHRYESLWTYAIISFVMFICACGVAWYWYVRVKKLLRTGILIEAKITGGGLSIKNLSGLRFTYEYQGKTYKQAVSLSPSKARRLKKLKTTYLLIDPNKPKRHVLVDFLNDD